MEPPCGLKVLPFGHWCTSGLYSRSSSASHSRLKSSSASLNSGSSISSPKYLAMADLLLAPPSRLAEDPYRVGDHPPRLRAPTRHLDPDHVAPDAVELAERGPDRGGRQRGGAPEPDAMRVLHDRPDAERAPQWADLVHSHRRGAVVAGPRRPPQRDRVRPVRRDHRAEPRDVARGRAHV